MKVGVLVSGSGTNLQALLDAEARGALDPATIACVISNRPDVPALGRAEAAGESSRRRNGGLVGGDHAFISS